MKKTLRLALGAFFSLIALGASAQTTIWEEDWQSSQEGKLVNEVTNPNAVYTLSSSNSSPYTKLWKKSDTEPNNLELLVPKKDRNEYWTAEINLNGNSGNLTLSYYYNKNQIDITSETSGVVISDVSKTGALINVPSGTQKLKLKFSNPMSSNARLDSIKLVTGGTAQEYPEVASIAALKALDSGTKAKLTFNNVQVNFASGSDMYVQDATGAIDIYGCNLSYTAGQKLNGTAVVEYKLYNSMPEITSITNASLTATDGTVTPNDETVEGITSAKICQLVKLTGTVYTEQGTVGSGESAQTVTNYFLEDDDNNSVQFYRKWASLDGTELDGLTDGMTATITGIVVLSNNTPAIGVTKAEYEGSEDVETVENIAALKAKAPTKKVRLTLTNAVVTFVNGKDMFVTDTSGSIDFYNCSLGYTAGKVLNGTIDVTEYKVYNKLPEITKVTNNLLEATDGTATPQEVAVTAITDDMACAYVKVSGTVKTEEVTITPSSGDPYQRTNYYLKDESDNKAPFYRKWSKLEGTDISVIKDGDTATITGIVVFSDGNAAIGVTAFEYVSANIENINAENAANGPIYNLAGQRVEKAVKGVYIQNGKKFIVK